MPLPALPSLHRNEMLAIKQMWEKSFVVLVLLFYTVHVKKKVTICSQMCKTPLPSLANWISSQSLQSLWLFTKFCTHIHMKVFLLIVLHEVVVGSLTPKSIHTKQCIFSTWALCAFIPWDKLRVIRSCNFQVGYAEMFIGQYGLSAPSWLVKAKANSPPTHIEILVKTPKPI